MADTTADEIREKIASLPPDVQKFLYSPEMHTLMQQIGGKHQLHIDQIGEMEGEVVAAMIGIEDIQKLPENLAEELKIDAVKSQALVKEINEQVFLKIRGSMKKTYEANKTVTPVAESRPAAANVVPISKPSPVVTPPVVPKPLEMHPADMMLTQKSVSSAPVMSAPAPKPPTPLEAPKIAAKPYGTDPYQEPIQ